MNKNYNKKVGNYVIKEQLGEGAFGSVYKCFENDDPSKVFAIKQILFESLQKSEGIVGQLLVDEIQVLSKIDNPNVLKLIHYFQTEKNCYIIMEYCDKGDLEKLRIDRGGKFPEQECIIFARQILNGLRALHESNVIHRDIKLANILVHQNDLKIADLGFCKQLENQDTQIQLCLGSPGTMAPEVLNFENYGLQADIFSVGCIIYQLLYGELPFRFTTTNQYLEEIKNQNIDFQRNGVKINQQLQEIISKMLKEDPKDRLTFAQLYKYSLFSNELSNSKLSKQNESHQALMTNGDHLNYYQNRYDKNQDQIIEKDKLLAMKTLVTQPIEQYLEYQQNPLQQQDLIRNNRIQQEMVLRTGNSYNNNQFNAPLYQNTIQLYEQNIQKFNQLSPVGQNQFFLQQYFGGLGNSTHQDNNIFQTNLPTIDGDQIQQYVKKFEIRYIPIEYLVKFYQNIENITIQEEYKVIFAKFIIQKKIRIEALKLENEIKELFKRQQTQIQKLLDQLQEIIQDKKLERFCNQIKQDQTAMYFLTQKQNWQGELQQEPTLNFLTIYFEVMDNLIINLKNNCNTEKQIKQKRNYIIQIIHAQILRNYSVLEANSFRIQDKTKEIENLKIEQLIKKIQ